MCSSDLVLCGVDVSGRCDGITSVRVSEIQEWRGRAGWILRVDRTLIKIDGSSVEVGACSVRNGLQLQIIRTLFDAASEDIAAVDDARVGHWIPRRASVQACQIPPSTGSPEERETYQTYISLRPGTTVISPR